MADHLKNTFQTQLTSTMDLLLRSAVCEITKVFESSVNDHQVELAQKGEEISMLRLQLEQAQVKLRERGEGADENKAVSGSEEVTNDSGQTPSSVAEIADDVPDDWCAPLGCENVVVQHPSGDQADSECPSVSLRPMSVSLWRIPAIKDEVLEEDFDSYLQTTFGSATGGNAARLIHQKDKGTSTLHPAIKREGVPTGKRRRSKRLQPGNEQAQGTVGQGKKTKITATEADADLEVLKNVNDKHYLCKFCPKAFDTEFGRSVHIRLAHKTCSGCREMFPFPSYLRRHMRLCNKLKNKGDTSSSLCENRPVYLPNNIPSTPKDRKYVCGGCHKQFCTSQKLKKHMHRYKGQNLLACPVCREKYHGEFTLKLHMCKTHNEPPLASGDDLWTNPLEEPVEDEVNTDSVSENQGSTGENGSATPRSRGKKRKSIPWETMGKQCPTGYSCLVCQKVLTKASVLVEHFRIHTGEKPVICVCGQTFRCYALRSTHRKKCPVLQLTS